ncbi:hypothetical protein [Pseudomonas fulva]|uniref:hypothetical protein n=1 Tax=Pseudomonas fulva TaxID=47880 RepID=UPI0015E3708B|nr:hypothetical protein [Pseudomonas fulva]MBA1218177.1 hypothetical protein [Pseudomonas fulva]
MPSTDRKYIRTEPPALLTEPLTITLDDYKLERFNAYRQARHAWLSCKSGPEESIRLHDLMADEARIVMASIGAMVQRARGEPDDYGPDDAE